MLDMRDKLSGSFGFVIVLLIDMVIESVFATVRLVRNCSGGEYLRVYYRIDEEFIFPIGLDLNIIGFVAGLRMLGGSLPSLRGLQQENVKGIMNASSFRNSKLIGLIA